MNLKRFRAVALLFLITLGIGGVAAIGAADAIYQVSVINALMEGVYDGDVTFADLRTYGDFGLGTVLALDGEMVALDGRFYQVREDGRAYELPKTIGTPFAAVTFFSPEQSVAVEGSLSETALQSYLLDLMGSQNVPYAIRITGKFTRVLVRSVGAQERPYPRLAEVLAQQVEFTHTNVPGTLVGFWLPGYLEGVNVPGLHLHFIDETRSVGGHVLSFEAEWAHIELDQKDQLIVVLPVGDQAFRSLGFAQQSSEELARIENVSVHQ